jgi:hypothetical protein
MSLENPATIKINDEILKVMNEQSFDKCDVMRWQNSPERII